MFLLRIRKDFDLVQKGNLRPEGPREADVFLAILCLTSLFVSLEIEIFSESVAKNVTWCFILTEMHYFVHYFCQKLYWFATIALLLLVCMLPKLFLMPTYNLSTFWQDEGPTNLDNHHELPLHLLRMTCASSSALQCYFRQFHFRRANLRLLCSDFANRCILGLFLGFHLGIDRTDWHFS